MKQLKVLLTEDQHKDFMRYKGLKLAKTNKFNFSSEIRDYISSQLAKIDYKH